jgi:hypothetical protein
MSARSIAGLLRGTGGAVALMHDYRAAHSGGDVIVVANAKSHAPHGHRIREMVPMYLG